MKVAWHAAELCLSAQSLLRLEKAQGALIHCTNGHLWITVTGQSQDIILAPGENYRVSGHGRVLIEALSPSRLRIADPATTSTTPDRRTHPGALQFQLT